MLEDERALIDAKYGATRLGFALLLKFYTRHGRFPTGPGDLPGGAVEFVARQLGVDGADLGSYEWAGRSIERHRAQIRERLGFRECTVADADRLTAWLAEHVAERERRHERVRNELLAQCRSERIEPPAPGRIDRIVRSALRVSEETLTARAVARLGQDSRERIAVPLSGDDDEAGDADGELALLATLKEAPGNVSLDTMLAEIDKLLAVRAVGVSAAVFASQHGQAARGATTAEPERRDELRHARVLKPGGSTTLHLGTATQARGLEVKSSPPITRAHATTIASRSRKDLRAARNSAGRSAIAAVSGATRMPIAAIVARASARLRAPANATSASP